MSIHLYDVACPSCGRVVWVNNGDVGDLTVEDVAVVRCCWCGSVFHLPDDDVGHSYRVDDEGDAVVSYPTPAAAVERQT